MFTVTVTHFSFTFNWPFYECNFLERNFHVEVVLKGEMEMSDISYLFTAGKSSFVKKWEKAFWD